MENRLWTVVSVDAAGVAVAVPAVAVVTVAVVTETFTVVTVVAGVGGVETNLTFCAFTWGQYTDAKKKKKKVFPYLQWTSSTQNSLIALELQGW